MAKKREIELEQPAVGKFPVGFYFSVSFGDYSNVDFQEVSGLSREQTLEEVAGGGENRFKYRLPSVSTSKNLVLKRASVPDGDFLTDWCNDTIDGGLANPIRTQLVSVNLLDRDGTVCMKWNFFDAYPVKYSFSDLKSQESEIVINNIELAYTYFTTT
ncbi:phage tail protein [Tenacibaculum agarivorans]|uniref:phage tail protein n=1 Tax=Tenacibaculum agarivorans TaxID=1908389 RepID=UPI00094B9293|nr:phage tail protein [Tenacibaculum agarivorans]